MRRVSGGFTACVVALVIGISSPSLASPSAPAPCYAVAHHIDAQHTGFSCTTFSSTPTKKWSVTLNGATSYPIIARGKVFVTTSNAGTSYGGWLYALNASDGTVAWGPVPLSGTYYWFAPAYGRGRVFVNDFDGTVRAFNADTGAQLWSRPTNYFSGEPVEWGGMVWVHGSGSIVGLSDQTGEIMVTTSYLDGSGSSPAVDSSGIYASTGCESQYRLTLTGSVVWFDNNGCSGGGSGTAYLWRGLMYGDNGHVVARKDNGDIVGSFAGRPAFMGTTGYFASGNALFAQNVTNGVPLWTTPVSGTITAGPVATSAAVFVGTSDARLVAIDPVSGAVIRSVRLPGVPGGGGQYSSCPSDIGVGDGLVVVPTGATVTAFG